MKTVQKTLIDPVAFLKPTAAHYIGSLADANIYDIWRTLFVDVFNRDEAPPLIVLDGAIGTGKTMFCHLAALRVLYEALEAGPSAYGFGAGETMHLVLCGRGLLDGLERLLKQAHRFCGKWVKRDGEIRFARDQLCVVGGQADDVSMILGLNVIGLIVDGANNPGVDGEKLKLLVQRVQRRIQSRKTAPGLVLVSGARTKNTSQLIGDGVIHKRLATWDPNPTYCGPERFSVAVYLKETKKLYNHIIAADETIESPSHPDQIISVPEDFRHEFEKDLEGSLRDLAGVAVGEAG